MNDTETVVIGLTPGADYSFSVTAENAVSSQDMNINDRTVNINATTEEGGTIVTMSINEQRRCTNKCKNFFQENQ